MREPKGVHRKCLLTCECVKTQEFFPGCLRCGFYAPEAERRKSLPLVFCEDGKQRKFIRRE